MATDKNTCSIVPLKPQPLPFDLPAKEWETVDSFGGASIKVPHVSCKDVALDWKQRVLLQTADGKEHCYNFNLLGQKP